MKILEYTGLDTTRVAAAYMDRLVREGHYDAAKSFDKQRAQLGRKHHAAYFARMAYGSDAR